MTTCDELLVELLSSPRFDINDGQRGLLILATLWRFDEVDGRTQFTSLNDGDPTRLGALFIFQNEHRLFFIFFCPSEEEDDIVEEFLMRKEENDVIMNALVRFSILLVCNNGVKTENTM